MTDDEAFSWIASNWKEGAIVLKFVGAMLSGLVTMSLAACLGLKRKKEKV